MGGVSVRRRGRRPGRILGEVTTRLAKVVGRGFVAGGVRAGHAFDRGRCFRAGGHTVVGNGRDSGHGSEAGRVYVSRHIDRLD